jgi:hypothetical protein
LNIPYQVLAPSLLIQIKKVDRRTKTAPPRAGVQACRRCQTNTGIPSISNTKS